MHKIIRYAFCIFCSLLVILVACLVYFTYFFSTDGIRKHLAEVLSAKTGYNVQLHQSAHIVFFPQFKASLYSIVLTTSRSAGLTPLMRAQQVDIDLSLLKALAGKLEFSNIKIVKPQFFLNQPVYDIGSAAQKIFNPQGIMRKSLATISIEKGRCGNIRDIMANIVFGGLQQQPYIALTAKSSGQALHLNTHIEVNKGNNIEFRDLTFSLGKFSLQGALQLTASTITGSLAIAQLDLQNLMQKLWANYIINAEHKKQLVKLDLRLSAATAKYKSLDIKTLAVTLQADSKKLILDIGNCQTPYGLVTGNIKAYGFGEKATVETALSSSKLDWASIVNGEISLNAKGAVNLQAKSTIETKQADNLLSSIIDNMSAMVDINADKGYLESYTIPAFDITQKTTLQSEQIINYGKKTKYNFKNLRIHAVSTPSLARVENAHIDINNQKLSFMAVKSKIKNNSFVVIKGKFCDKSGPYSEFFLAKPGNTQPLSYIVGPNLPVKYLDKTLQTSLRLDPAVKLCVK